MKGSPKAVMQAFAEEVHRSVPEIARIVGTSEAEYDAIPELVQALTEQIVHWRRF